MAISWTGSAVTGQVQGDSQPYQAICILYNDKFSSHNIYVKKLMFQIDPASVIVASTTLFVPMITYRGSVTPTFGNFSCYAQKCSFNSLESSDPLINLYYPATGGGVNDSTLSGTSGAISWRQWGSKLRTGAKQVMSEDNNQLPVLVQNNNWKLSPGEYLLVRADPVVNSNNNTGLGWFVNAVWQEEPISTHSISGTVKLSGVGVVGAKVTVLVASDTTLSDAKLWGIYTTGAGGTWSTPTDIPDGKVAYAYAQDYTGGTYYTASGNPYVI